MKEYQIHPAVLMQYVIHVPADKSVRACMDTVLAGQLTQMPYLSVIGRHGELQSLNLSATLIMEGLRENLSVQEILTDLIRRFAGNRETAVAIFRDMQAFLQDLAQKEWIIPAVSERGASNLET